MKPEKKPTKTAPAVPLKLNDIGFRLVLIPFFGIAIPLLTHMIPAAAFGHWQLKTAYAYTILLAFVIWQGNRYLLFSLRSYFDWFNKPVQKILTLIVAVSFFTIPVSAAMLVGWYYLFRKGVVDWQVVTTSTLIIMICVLFITHVYETVFLVKQTESERVRSEQLERARAESELIALKNQIDPHFMFNSLNTLSCLIEEAPLKALEFNEHLADVYRYILQNKSRQLVMVHEELLFLEDYFALQKIRYGKGVQLQVDIPPAVKDHYLMPPISLQLLAENAFKHNEFSTSSPLCLQVTVEEDALLVSNPIHRRKKENPSHHIGLRNLQERYLLLTGKPIQVREAELHFTVRLPLLKIQ